MHIGIDATALPKEPGGAGTYIIQLIRALVELQPPYKITVIAHQNGYNQINIPTKPGLAWIIVGDKKPAKRLVWEQVRLPGLVRKTRVDLLHSLHYTRPAFLPCRSVVTFHDMTFFIFPHLHTRLKRLFFPSAIRLSARKADAIIAVSESTRTDTIRLLNISGDKVFTVPEGVGKEFRPISDGKMLADIRHRYNLPHEFFLYVGTIEPRKNLQLLIKSYNNLTGRGHSIPLVIVGNLGWMYDDVLHQIEVLDLRENIHFTGYVPIQDLPSIYNLAKIFVYPSTYEGFGLPPLEAMACGTPVITTAVSSIPEHVGDGGILIPPEDEAALTQAMLKLLNDQTFQTEMSHRGPQQAKLFTWKHTAKETTKVYQHILESP
ncbi:glycosyltransferase family 4 protein [Chloroflexota bacterium]